MRFLPHCDSCGLLKKDVNEIKGSKDLSKINDYIGVPLDIIIIDDDSKDSALTLEILGSEKFLNNPKVFYEPQKALDYLSKSHEITKGSLSDLVLLDYSMPGLNGLDVLKEIRENPNTHNIPVFILTNSYDEEVVLQSSKYKAQGFLKKPIDINDFISKIKEIPGFGLMVAKLPTASPVE